MDKARKWTDKELNKLTKKITNIYAEALDDLQDKWNSFMLRAQKRISKQQASYEDAIKSGDKVKIENANKNLQKAKQSALYGDAKYNKLVQQFAERMAKANQTAINYANNTLPDIYLKNY